MIQLESIAWENLLSTGNQRTEIILNEHATTLIAGENGSGKSTIMDALTFALFNKPFRKINKPQLVNSITNKGLLVEVAFRTNGRQYVIKRGQKPNLFEIYQDGTLINQEADNRDYQKTLEQAILKMNYKTFCQVVVLGSANFTPFMQLAAAQRREIIEDLLDIQVFSIMNSILKIRVNENKDDLSDCDHRINMLQTTIDLKKKHSVEIAKNHEFQITQAQAQIDEYQAKIDEAQKKLKEHETQIDSLKERLKNRSILEERMASLHALKAKGAARVSRLQKEIEFFLVELSCPTCKQTISEEFKADRLSQLRDKQQGVSSKLETVDAKLLEYGAKKEGFEKISKELGTLQKAISAINAEIATHNSIVTKLVRTISETKARRKEALKPQDDDCEANLELATKRKQTLLEERELNNIALMLLKDGGIKTQIIKQYIPIMNTLINKYLDQMEFFCQFEINEQFEEVIKSRYRDEFSYDSFSQGEKMRIDLALLFAWREISRMRNSASINLLILDEIMDSSLDAAGTDEFTKIVGQLTGDNNVIVISHKHEQIHDKFDRVIRFEKIQNFSKMVE